MDLRALLEERRAEAEARVAATAATLAELMHDREGSNDDDEHDPEGVTLSGLAEAAQAELRQVDEALMRMDAGTYGICAHCGRPIPPERLEVRPFAEYCVACAEKLGR